MTKAKISEYDATAANNTDANGVNIAEGCAPSGINNAIREVMAALKRFETGADGDSVTVGGNLVVSGSATLANTATLGNVDINGGTIDGAVIGGASAAAGTFTTLTASSPSVISVNSSSNALRITQVGSGNALLVEDSANPDATPFVIDASGRLLIGTTASDSTTVTANSQVQLSSPTGTGSTINMTSWSATGSVCPFLQINKSNSGTVGSRGVVASGDSLGGIQFNGDDGTAFIRGAQIVAVVDGTPGTNDMPGRLVFSTTADGASSPTERMRITQDGYVRLSSNALGIQFGGDTAAANALDDYEEGTWTPAISSASGWTSGTPSSVTATYTKIGNIVRLYATFILSGSSGNVTANDRFTMTGAPFAASNNTFGILTGAPDITVPITWLGNALISSTTIYGVCLIATGSPARNTAILINIVYQV